MSLAVGLPPQPEVALPPTPPSGPGAGIEIAVRETAGQTWMSVRGELDILTAPKLRSALRTCAERSDGDVLLDLAGLDFIGALGLSVLIEGRRRLEARRRRLSVVAPSACVRRLLELTDLAEMFALTSGPASAPA